MDYFIFLFIVSNWISTRKTTITPKKSTVSDNHRAGTAADGVEYRLQIYCCNGGGTFTDGKQGRSVREVELDFVGDATE